MNPVSTSVRKVLGLAAVAAAIAALPAISQATPVVLQDGNSIARFRTEAADELTAGLYEWNVDGVNHVQQQWFWFRVGSDSAEIPLSAIPQTSISILDIGGDPTPDLLRSVYLDGTSGLRFTLTYQLTGGTAGSRSSDISEVIKIDNLSGLARSVHFFQYSDFNLNGTPANDVTSVTGGNTADVTDGGITASETVVVPRPAHFEVGLVPSTLASLNNGGPTTLNDVPGPIGGDTSWAFQWDVTIQPGGTFIISKDKQIQPVVPEPASLGLLAIGAVAALSRRRRA